MKKQFEKHKFTFFLFSVTTFLCFLFIINLNSKSDFITIEVQPGDSLWQISSDYSESHNLSKEEFISWVEKENQLLNEIIVVGQEIIIPVDQADLVHTELLANK